MGPFRLILACLAAGAVGFGTVMLLFEIGLLGQGRSAQSSRPIVATGPSRCEVEFPAERCRAQPSFRSMDQRGIYVDTFEGADKDADRCTRRAEDYFNWCQSTQPITARFYRGSTVVRSATKR